MPAPERTSMDAIVRTGAELVEEGGLPALTMQAVALRVGVRAPSLYKRVRSRDDLVRLVTEATVRDLAERLTAAEAPDGDPRTNLLAVARAFRRFAHERPGAYHLVFARVPDQARADPELLASASAAVMRVAQGLAGPDHVLAAARTVTAWAHGFVTLELAGAFRLGGDVDAAFDFGLERVADALACR